MLLRIVTLLVLILPINSVFASNFDFEFGLNSGRTGNVLKDKSSLGDTYVSAFARTNYHPFASTQIRLQTEYTSYKNMSSLGSILYGAGGTYIPTPDSSKFQVYLSGNIQKLEYRGDDASLRTSDFNSSNWDASVSAGYNLSEQIRARAGFIFKSIGYGHEEIDDRQTKEIFSGLNLSLPGNNVLDIEGGYTTGNFEYVYPWTDFPQGDSVLIVPRSPIDSSEAYSVLEESKLNSYYIAPRFSRSLGQRTGLSITYMRRRFTNFNDDAFIYGYSTGRVSPWVSSYEGDAISITVKSFLIPKIIVSAGFGYWDRSYNNIVEAEAEQPVFPLTVLNNIQERKDFRRQLFLNLQWPTTLFTGRFAEPSIRIEHISNSSSINVYDYSDFTISSSLLVRF